MEGSLLGLKEGTETSSQSESGRSKYIFFNCEVLRGIGKYCEVMQSIARYYKVLQSIGRFDGVLYGIARYLRYCKVLPLSPPPPRARLWLQYLGRKLQHDY